MCRDPGWVQDPGLVSLTRSDYMHSHAGGGPDPALFVMVESRKNVGKTGGSPGSRRALLSDVPRVHGETALQKVGGRWVAATPDDQLHSFEGPDGVVSEVGERIVELIDGRRSVEEIVQALLVEFEVPREVAEADTLDFIALLAEKHVLSL